MPSGRWKKLAIAGAILIIGIVTAWQFRHEPTLDSSTASKSPATVGTAPEVSTASKSVQPEAKLAGRIEPYSGRGDSVVATGMPSSQQSPEAKAEQGDRGAESNPGRQISGSTTAVAERAANVASGAGHGNSPGNPSVKSPAMLPQGNFAIDSARGTTRTALDRFGGSQAEAATRPLPDKRHRIVDGDTLMSLASRYMGAAERHGDLFEYNRDVLTTPELLPIGKELRIPPADFAPPAALHGASSSHRLTAAAPVTNHRSHYGATPAVGSTPAPLVSGSAPARTYVVQPHDTLALIARKLYGDMARQQELLAANRQQLRSPGDLRPGMMLVVPATR